MSDTIEGDAAAAAAGPAGWDWVVCINGSEGGDDGSDDGSDDDGNDAVALTRCKNSSNCKVTRSSVGRGL